VADKLQDAIVLDALREAALTSPDQQLPSSVRVKHGISHDGRKLHYFLNYSSSPAAMVYSYGAGTELLTGQSFAQGQQTTLGPWDLIIVRE
jgi:beta-galactosidase